MGKQHFSLLKFVIEIREKANKKRLVLGGLKCKIIEVAYCIGDGDDIRVGRDIQGMEILFSIRIAFLSSVRNKIA